MKTTEIFERLMTLKETIKQDYPANFIEGNVWLPYIFEDDEEIEDYIDENYALKEDQKHMAQEKAEGTFLKHFLALPKKADELDKMSQGYFLDKKKVKKEGFENYVIFSQTGEDADAFAVDKSDENLPVYFISYDLPVLVNPVCESLEELVHGVPTFE